MPRLDHRAFINTCRDERGVGHHTLRAYAQDLRTFARYTDLHQITEPISRDDILGYHRHLRDEIEAKPATIERRLVTLKSYFAWREGRNAALPSPFADLRISVRIPRRLPRPVDRETLKVVLCADNTKVLEPTKPKASEAGPPAMADVTILIIKLLIVTGLRISELTNLKVRDVSPDGGQILVNGKGSKERIVFVPNRELQEDFQCFLPNAFRRRLYCGTPVPEHGRSPAPRRHLPQATAGPVKAPRYRTTPDPAPIPALGGDAADRRRHRHPDGPGLARAC